MLDKALMDRLLDVLMRLPGIEERSTRTAMLSGIGVALNRTDNQFVDLTNIVSQLDKLGRLGNGERPVVILAHNAARMVTGTDLGREIDSLKKEVEEAYGGDPLMPDLPTKPEVLIFGGPGEWVTTTFLAQAALVANRVARIRVPRIVSGVQEDPVGALGTAWLIGPRLLLTNHHVVKARERGEPPPTAKDFAAQAKGAAVWFDYHVEGRGGVEAEVEELVNSSAELDYALLALAGSADVDQRKPVALPQQAHHLKHGTRLNIVQCPRGGPLVLAIRNNFFVGRGDQPFQIRYLTDTDEGSSGAPVCDDDWQVVALHQGAQKVDPQSYAGEPGFQGIVKFHNQGIDIQAILADLPQAATDRIKRAQGWI
ncbi:serine protease [Mesorhizobium sp. M1060]|uniref:trypsin-like serine peptidase n=1 Tax=unclassified Mesorhizobium TaxID=325217 RepID=UPI000406318C|nr:MULTISPECIES: serine protease [unclassified Mesorhizobium]WJI52349.1 serine protease [Mesorhizobium sp. C089B]